MNWREYHDPVKHSSESLRRSTHHLDGANRPGPFRYYEGAPLVHLPGAPRSRRSTCCPARPSARRAAMAPRSSPPCCSTRRRSARRSRWRTPAGNALRVNPPPGNRHPAEFPFLASGLAGWPDGRYHYLALEQLGRDTVEAVVWPLSEAFDGLPAHGCPPPRCDSVARDGSSHATWTRRCRSGQNIRAGEGAQVAVPHSPLAAFPLRYASSDHLGQRMGASGVCRRVRFHRVELFYGRRGRTRTCDPLLRRQMLYPPELRAPVAALSALIISSALRGGTAAAALSG